MNRAAATKMWWRAAWQAVRASRTNALPIVIGGGATGLAVSASVFSPFMAEPLTDAKASSSGVSVPSEHRYPLFSLYAWGMNKSKVAAPQDENSVVPYPEDMPPLDGIALRDVQVSDSVGVAVDANGNLIQWGTGFDEHAPQPALSITGFDIQRVQICGPKLFALSRSGDVYVFATHRSAQMHQVATWFRSPFNYIRLHAKEKMADIAAGDHHLLALSRGGQVYSVPTDYAANEYGQLGYSNVLLKARDDNALAPTVEVRLEPKVARVARFASQPPTMPKSTPDLTAMTVDSSDIRFATELRPIPSLQGVPFAQIAAGANHSVLRTLDGRVLTWGQNTFGQLGLGANVTVDTVAVPSEVGFPVSIVGRHSTCTNIAAGGNNTFFVVHSHNAPVPSDTKEQVPRERIDVLSAGNGQRGTLGNGQRSQTCSEPKRVRGVSGLYEYSEVDRCMRPIRVHALSVGHAGQCALVMDAPALSTGETRRDVYMWGNNDMSQLGQGGKGHSTIPALLKHTKPTTLSGTTSKSELTVAPMRVLLVEQSNVRGKAWNGKERKYSKAEQRIVAGGSCVVIFTQV